MANQHGKRYVGSTSSISAVLSQIYFMLSNFKKVNTSHLSSDFQKEVKRLANLSYYQLAQAINTMHSLKNLPEE
jgi:hypothetical protein